MVAVALRVVEKYQNQVLKPLAKQDKQHV